MLVWFSFAARNLLRQKKRSIMLGSAVAFCVCIMTLMTTLTTGMSTSLHTNFSQTFGGHVFVTGTEVSSLGSELSIIQDRDSVEAALAAVQNDIDTISRRSSVQANLVFSKSTVNLTLLGVDYAHEQRLLDSLTLVSGDLERSRNEGLLILPSTQAADLGVTVGETVLVKGRTLTGQQNLADWEVGAIVESTESIGSGQGYAPRVEVNTLLNVQPDAYQSLNLFLTDMDRMNAVADRLKEVFAKRASITAEDADEDSMIAMIEARMGGNKKVTDAWDGTRFDVSTLEDRLGDVLSLVTGLTAASEGVFVLMLVITMVGINNAFRMVIVERTQEIGTLRAMGAQRLNVKAMLLWEAAGIALVGGLAGLIVGLVALLGIGQLTMTEPPLTLFTLNQHPVITPNLVGLALILGSVLLMSVLAAFLPARTAARLSPAEALRSAA